MDKENNKLHYTLTKAKESDFSEIYHIKKASVKRYVEEIWGWDEQYQLNEFKNDFKNRDDFSLIMIGSELAGFLQLASRENTIYIVEIHLMESFRGKGIGTSIIRELIKKARKNNQRVMVGCFKQNIKAKKLYLKLGFDLVRETASHYEFELKN